MLLMRTYSSVRATFNNIIHRRVSNGLGEMLHMKSWVDRSKDVSQLCGSSYASSRSTPCIRWLIPLSSSNHVSSSNVLLGSNFETCR